MEKTTTILFCGIVIFAICNLIAVAQFTFPDGESSERIHPPRDFRIESETTDEVILVWEHPLQWNLEKSGYEIAYWEEDVLTVKKTVITISKDQTRHSVKGLKPSTKYTFKLTAYSQVAEKRIQAFVHIPHVEITREPQNPSKPRNLMIVSQTVEKTVLGWKQPIKWTGLQGGYIISYGGDDSPWTTIKIDGKDQDNVALEGLFPSKQYAVKFQSYVNAQGAQMESEPVELTIPPLPEISQPSNLNATEITSSSVQLEWQKPKNVQQVSQYAVYYTSKDETHVKNTIDTQLRITQLNPWTNYKIEVAAIYKIKDNIFRSKNVSIKIKTQFTAPSKPESVRITRTKATSLTVEWKEPLHLNGPFCEYLVKWTEEGKPQSVLTKEFFYAIVNLKPWTDYDVIVIAINCYNGTTAESEPAELTAKTLVSEPGAPASLAISYATSTSLAATWKAPREPNGPIDGYVIMCTDSNGNLVSSVSTSETAYTFNNLDLDQEYDITVKAYNTLVLESSTENLYGPAVFETKKTELGVPGNLNATAITSSSVHLKWDKPKDFHHVLQYAVYYSSNDEVYAENTTKTEVDISDLKPWTEYEMKVAALYKIKGKIVSSSNATINTKTNFSAPGKPESVKVTHTTVTKITLEWTAPQVLNGPFCDYVVRWNDGNEPQKVNTKETWYAMVDLLPLTSYDVSLTARNCFKETAAESEPVQLQVNTSISAPTPPRHLRIVSQTVERIYIGWDQPQNWNAPEGGYILTYLAESSTVTTIRIDKETTDYKLEGLKPWIPYTIDLVAYNEFQDVQRNSSSVTVTIPPTKKPPGPANVKAIEITSTSVHLIWEKPEDVADVSQYAVYYLTNDKTHTEYTKGTDLSIFQLKPWTNYEIKLAALYKSSDIALSSDNVTTDFQTDFSAPSKPESVSITRVEATSLTVEWTKPLFLNGPLCDYLVKWTEEGKPQSVPTKLLFYPLVNLNPWTDYEVNVTARNCFNGTEAESEPAETQGKTDVSVPSIPNDFVIGDATNSSLTASWKTPLVPNGPIKGYVLTCTDPHGKLVANVTTPEKSHIFKSLDGWAEYNITVKAYNERINKSLLYGPTAFGTMKTMVGVPTSPINLRVVNQTVEKTFIAWDQPLKWNGPQGGYVLTYLAENSTLATIRIDKETTTVYKLEGLEPWITSTIDLLAYNEFKDEQRNSTVVSLTIPPTKKPPGPANVITNEITSASAHLIWKKPEDVADVSQYAVYYTTDDKIHTEYTNETEFNITQLKPWTKYEIELAALYKTPKEVISSENVTTDFQTDFTAPSKPESVNITRVEATSLTVEWTKPLYLNGPFCDYLVKWTEEGKPQTVSTKLLFYALVNLKPWTDYEVNVTARNCFNGTDAESEPAKTQAKTDVSVPSIPDDFAIGDATNSTLTASWKIPLVPNGPINGYVLTCTDPHGKLVANVTTSERNHTFEGLDGWTEYNITIKAYNVRINKSPLYGPTAFDTMKTTVGAPTPPRNLRIVSQTLEKIYIGWDQPENWNGPGGGFFLTYLAENSTVTIIRIEGATSTDYKLEGLEPWIPYTIDIMAYNEFQDKQRNSSSVSVTIPPKEKPPGPANVKTIEITSTSVHLIWEKPEDVAEVSQYVVYYTTDDKIQTEYTNETEFNITQLKPWTNYEINLAALYILPNKVISSENVTSDFQTDFIAPSKPESVNITHVGATSLTVEWEKPLLPNGPLCDYLVKWTEEGKPQSVPTKLLFYALVNLKPWTDYEVNVTARNCFNGTEAESEPAETQAKTDVSMPSTPEDFAIGDATNSSLTASWKMPLVPNGPIDGYVITCTDPHGKLVDNVTTSDKNHTFKGLHIWTEYNITVKAYNVRVNKSPLYGPSVFDTKKTMVGVPSVPEEFAMDDVTNETVTVSWSKPEVPNGPIDGYVLNCTNSEGELVANVTTKDTNYTLENLHPWEEYNISVAAFNTIVQKDHNVNLYGPAASGINKTDVGVPGVPDKFVLDNVTSTSLTASWKAPVEPNGPVDGYVLTCTGPDGKIVANLTTKEEIFMFKGLQVWSQYKVTVKAYNIQVHDKSTVNLLGPAADGTIKTAVEAPSVPEALVIGDATNTSLTASWKAPKVPNGPIDGYFITCTDTDGELIANATTKNTSYTLKQLKPWKYYNMNVTAFNILVQTGSTVELFGPAATGVQKTNVGVPSAPEDFAFSAVTSKSLTAKWEAPLEPNGPIDGYYLVCTDIKGKHVADVITPNTNYTFSGLHPCKDFNVTVAAFNALADNSTYNVYGLQVSAIQKTLVDEPSMPEGFVIDDVTNTSLTASWKAPLEPNGPIDGYVISCTDPDGEVVAKETIKGTNHTFIKLHPWKEFIVTVSAFNDLIQDNSSVQLNGPSAFGTKDTLAGVPSEPVLFVIGNVTNTSLTATWEAPLEPNGPIDGYVVTCSNPDRSHVDIVATTNTSYTFTELKPWVEYNITITAYNKLFQENTTLDLYGPTTFATNRTDVGVPSEPNAFVISDVTDTSLSASWDEPLQPNGPIDGYHVRCTDNKGKPVATNTTTETSYTFKGLHPWKVFNITVAAYNLQQQDHSPIALQGPGTFGTKQTLVGEPGLPSGFVVDDPTSTSLTAFWAEPQEPNGPIDGYFLTCKELDGTIVVNVTTQSLNYTINALNGWREYNVTVKAYNKYIHDNSTKNLYGPPAFGTLQTTVGEPGVPDELVISNVTNSSLTASWEAPSEPNGPIAGYVLTCSDLAGHVVLSNVTTSNTSFTVSELSPWRDYNFTVTAFNEIVDKNDTINLYGETASRTNKTAAGAPPNPKKNLTIASTDKESAFLNLPVQMFPEDNGPIIEYILLISGAKSEDMVQQRGFDLLNETGFKNWYEYKDTEEWYRSSPENWDYQKDNRICKDGDKGLRKCEVGADKPCAKGQICDGPLKKDTKYWAKVRAYTDGGWVETFPVTFTTGNVASKSKAGVLVLMVVTAIWKLVA